MSDVSGIPNMGFGGGGYFGGIPNVAPAMSADQINRSMWGNYSPQQAQATFNQISGGLNRDPAHYAALGASYGRATGGFGRLPSGAVAPPGRVGTIGNPYGGGGVPLPQARPPGAWAVPQGTVTRGPDLIAPNYTNPITGSRSPMVQSQPRSPFTSMTFGGNRDTLAALLQQNASPRAPALGAGGDYSSPKRSVFSVGGIGSDMRYGGQNSSIFGGKQMERFPMGSSGATDFSGQARAPLYSGGGIGSDRLFGGQNSMTGGIGSSSRYDYSHMIPGGVSRGYVSPMSRLAPAGRGDPYFMASNAAGFNPSRAGTGGIGSDMRYGGQNMFSRPNQIHIDSAIDAVTPDFNGRFGGFGSSPFQMPQYSDPRGRGITDFGGQSRSPQYSGGGIGSDMRYGGQSALGKSDRLAMFQPRSSGGIGSDMLRGGQNQLYAQPWHGLIPTDRGLNTPEIIKEVNYAAGRHRTDPASIAGFIGGAENPNWDPRLKHNSYYGLAQMGKPSFDEAARAGRPLGGMSWNQYKAAPAERQVAAYSDWLGHYGRSPGTAAALATSDIRRHPVPLQTSILQGTQFGPNSRDWPAAFARGDMSQYVSPVQKKTGLPAPQAQRLGLPYPTLNSMNNYFTGVQRR